MAINIVQSNSGNTGASTASSASATLPSPTTNGNAVVLVVGSDDVFNTPSGWTMNTNCKTELFFGHYVYVKSTTGGETSWTISPTGTCSFAWIVVEIGNVTATPFDLATSQVSNTGLTDTYSTPNLTPTSGERLLFATIGGSLDTVNGYIAGWSGWTNSFTEVTDTWTAKLKTGSPDFGIGGTNQSISVATCVVTANGSTAYNTSATSDSASTPESESGIILALKGSGAGGGSSTATTAWFKA